MRIFSLTFNKKCIVYFYLPFLICVLRSLLYFHSYNKYSLVKPIDTLTGKVCEKVCVLFVCLFFGIIYLKYHKLSHYFIYKK